MSTAVPRPRLGFLAFLFLIALFSLRVTPVRGATGPVLNPANGHYYEIVAVPGSLLWDPAKVAAEARIYQGMQGHLATLTSQSENDWLVNTFPVAVQQAYWLGGYVPSGIQAPQQGWRWVTDEPWVFSAWGPGQPDGWSKTGNHLNLLYTVPGKWNDDTFDPLPGYVVEYEPTPPAPPSAPASLTAAVVSSTRVDLSWAAATGTVTEYLVERKFGTVPFTQIANLTDTTLSDSNLRPGTAYTYRVRAYNGGGVSQYSTEAVATTTANPTHPDSIIRVNLKNNGVVYDPVGDRLYASVPSDVPDYGNCIVQIDPASGAILNSVFVGSEPERACISDDGQYLYVFLSGSAQVRRVNLRSLTAEIQFPLGVDGLGNWYAECMEVIPHQPHALMVTSKHLGSSPRSAGTAIYDDGVRRPAMNGWSNRHSCLPDGKRAIIVLNESSGAETWWSTIDSNGANRAEGDSNVAATPGFDAKFVDGLVYADNGRLFDPFNNVLVGTYSGATGFAVVDSAVNRVYFLTGWGSATTIRAYNQTTFVGVGSLPISGLNEGATSFAGVGTDGFAFRISTQILIVHTALRPAGPPPPPAPAAPTGLSAIALSSSQIDLSWTDASNNETGFKIQRKSGAAQFATVGTVASNVVTYSDQGLQPNTTYTYQVIATNSGVDSAPSSSVPATTLRIPPSAPTNLLATAAGSSRVDLQWQDNSTDEDGFEVERAVGGGAFTPVGAVGPNATTYSDTSVGAATTYTYRVRAVAGNSASSYAVSTPVTTPAGPPAAPTDLTGSSPSSTTILLSWTDRSNNETGFHVERSTDGTTFVPAGTTDANATSFLDTGLPPNTTYRYRVRAYNASGESAPSNTAVATTQQPPLVPPSNFTAVLAGAQVTLSWMDNTSNEDSFLIDRAAGNNPFVLFKVVGANVTSYVDTELAPETTYTYRVRANRGNTASDPSNTASITTLPAPPASPTNLTATAAGQAEIDLSWTDASPNEDGFRIERSTDGTNFAPLGSRAANQTTYADTSLAPGTTYFYRVRAFNAGGESINSNTAKATTAPTAPDLPSGLQVTGRTQTSISLAWTAGVGATSYEVERGDGVTFSRVGAPMAPTFMDTGLQPNTAYTYRVRAVNAGGFSGYTANVTGTTLPNPPAAPGNLQANAFSSTSIRVTWSIPTGTITGYRLERSGDGGVSWTPLGPISTSDTGFLDTGLQASTTYQYRLRASNAGGDGPYAGPVSATTLAPPPNPPAPPQNLRSSGMTASSIQLAWNVSAGATSYVVERKSGTGEFGVLGSVDGTTYTDAGVTAGVAYTYRVKAANAGGESGYSSMLGVTIPAAGKLKLSTTTLSFGKVVHGKTVQKTLTLTNIGRGPLVVNVGTVDAPFNVALGTGSYTLQPKQSQKVTVRFSPSGKTAYSRSLVVTTTDPAAASVSVALSGSGK